MRSEEELRKLKDELERLSAFIGEFGTDKEFEHEDVKYSADVSDALDWVLGEITTERFRSDDFLNIDGLKGLAKRIEERTGKKLKDYR